MLDKNKQSLLLGKISAYTEILVKDPGSTIFVSLAETYRKLGMFDDARQIVTRGLELHPELSSAYIVMARILCQLKDFSGSVTNFEHALVLDPDNLSALVGYARVQILLGKKGDARKILLKARSLSPADPVINKLLLSLPREPEVGEESSDDFFGEVDDEEISPPLVSTTLAELYLVQGLTSKALDIFQRLSVQNPDDLSFRRKIKQLEGLLEQDTRSQDETIATDKSTESDVSERDTALQQPTEIESDGAHPVPATESKQEQVLSTLNNWLSNIQQRRGNV